jgi:hypothetical protein
MWRRFSITTVPIACSNWRQPKTGASPRTFIDALRAIARLNATDWAEDGVSADVVAGLYTTFERWRHNLTADN